MNRLELRPRLRPGRSPGCVCKLSVRFWPGSTVGDPWLSSIMSVRWCMLLGMTSWAEFQCSAPEMADTVRHSFAIRKHATMATIRRDGAPRISGTEVEFADDGEIYLGMMAGARRAVDLRREPRVAVHCPTADPPEEDPERWLGDGKITARAIEVEPHRFRLAIAQVVLTRVAPGAQELEITTWTPASGINVVRRS